MPRVITEMYSFSVAHFVACVASLKKIANLKKEQKDVEERAESYRKVSVAKTQECELLQGKRQKQESKQTSGK